MGAVGGGRHLGQEALAAQLQAQVQTAQRGRVERERHDVGGLAVGAAAAGRRLLDLDVRPQLQGAAGGGDRGRSRAADCGSIRSVTRSGVTSWTLSLSVAGRDLRRHLAR